MTLITVGRILKALVPAVLVTQAGLLQGQTTVGVPLKKQAQAQSTFLSLPLSFERQGEGAQERYVAQGNGYVIGLDKGRAVIGLPSGASKNAPGKLISLDFIGGKDVNATPENQLPGKVNRYTGNDPRQWKTGLPTFGKVAYKDVYPGIDVVYYGNQRQLEFDFVVKPGADPSAIRMKIGGSRKLRIDGVGALVVDEIPDLKISLPEVYQETAGSRHKIAGRYEIRGKDEVAFALESWDRSKPLIIDPALNYPHIVYSGLIGGGSSSSSGYGVAIDGSGNTYISGNTYASDFPVVSPAQSGANLSGDGFVLKINAAGTALLYSTYLGGSGYDGFYALALDSTGAAWVTGQTQSSDFPLLNATQSSYGGNSDAMVAKLSSTGVLQFSSYLGGNNYDTGNGIAVDSSNNAYVAGFSQSSNFPTTTGALLTSLAGFENAFVTKFSSSGTIGYSTLAGGTDSDSANAVAVDSAGDAYFTGYTYSPSFTGAPSGGAQTTNQASGGDAFVAKLNPAGSALSYFTFLGGTASQQGQAIALDSSNNAYIAGTTTSAGQATAGAAQSTINGGTDSFIAKLNSTGSAITYFTYLGGNRQDYVKGLALDQSGNAYVAGYTDSNVIPSVAPLQPTYPGNPISLYQTVNSGSSWTTFDTGITGAVLDISADPVTSGIVLVATENGIFRTTNGGASWTQSLTGAYVTSLARSPSTPSTIYALNPNNVYISTDDGVTWQYSGNTNTGYFDGLIADPLTATTVYAYSQENGVYVSTDGGATWTAANNGLPQADVPAMVAGSDGPIYASVPGYGIYKSTTHGSSWVAVNTGLSAYFYAHSLAASGSTIYAGWGTIYTTTNDGASWTPTSGYTPNGSYIIGVSPTNPSVIYSTAFGGGVYLSTDAGATWNPINTGIANVTQMTEFAFDPLNSNRAFLVAPVSQVGFIAELNTSGSAFLYNSWFGAAGGNSYTEINGLAANSSGDVYVTGYTSTDTGGAFPGTTTAFQGAGYGAFVARISDTAVACSVALGPASQIVPGYGNTLGLSAIAPGGCAWSASSNQNWAVVARGAAETGTDAVTVQLAYNSTGATRTATITAGSGSATITQADGSCNYALSSYNLNEPASGGTTSIALTTTAGCPWSVTNTYPFAVSVTSGASGTGNGTISLSVGQNYSTAAQNYYLTIGSTQLSIAQAGACSYTFNPPSTSFTAAGGSGSFGVTASSSNCSWTATPSNLWITLSGATSGTGNGTVNYTVAPNAGVAQTGTIGIGGYNFTITEAGSSTSTTTSLVSSVNPSAVGQNVMLTATVTPSTATGNITFMDGATSLGSVVLSGGSAVLNTSTLAVGSHSITAVYSGDANDSGSTSAVVTQTVNKTTTTTGLTALPNPSTFGQSVAFTASVTPVAATGNITFMDGATSLGSVVLSGGSAVLNTSTLAVGSHSITAVYSGDANDSGSTSAVVTQTVNKTTTTTGLTALPNPSTFGQSVAFTATVTPVAATGNITFMDGATSLGSVVLSGGSAVLNTSTLAVGSHSITAVYSGDANDSGSSSAVVTQTVNKTTTTTGLTALPNPSTFGQSVAFTASVTPVAATGNITFMDGATSLGSVVLSGGSAVLNTSTLAVGSHSITAVYSGDANDSGSTSAVVTQTVNKTNTTTGLTALPNPSTFGQSVAFTASVTPVAATGNITFMDGATSLGSVVLSGGSAVLNTSTLAVGSHSITAVYSGDANDSGSTSAVVTQTVNKTTTTTGLTALPNPSTFGQSVAFTASVTPVAATGNITFMDGATSLGSVVLNGGSAVLNTSTLAVGSHSITAVYSGDANDSGSTSAVVTQTVNKTTTTTGLTALPNPSTFGQSVAFTASVTPVAATGNITFMDGATSLGSVVLSGGSAVLNTSTLAVGSHSITAVYSGDANDSGSTSAVVTQTVSTKLNTTTSLTALPNPSNIGQSVTLTASVSPGAATGSVTFMDGTASLGSVALANGSAVLNTANLTAGAHSLTAVYSGDTTYAGSTSIVVTQTVNKLPTLTIISLASPDPSTFGQSVAFTASVTPLTATGSLTFMDGTTSLGSVALTNGSAILNISTLSVGSHPVTAVYSGDSTYAVSTSAVLTQTVNKITTSTSLVSAPVPSTFGQSVAFTATVTPASATGSVSFSDGGNALGSIALAGGTAVLNISTLSVGAHAVTATYSGDNNDAGSASAAVMQTVNKAVSQTTLTSSLNPSVYGAGITLTATVTPITASGTVTFMDGNSPLGTGVLSAGVATFSLSTLAVGAHSITANYPGDGNDVASASIALVQTVGQAQPTIYLTSVPNPTVVGQTVTLTASVIPSTATGSITFNDGRSTIATVEIAGGTATTTSTLAAGAHNLTASYSGDANFLSAVSAGDGPALFFTSAIPGTILDSAGQGTGFTTRLPGTGGSIAANDPNLTVNTANGTLTWQTTPSDLNGQVNLAAGDFIGFPLSAAGVTLNEDFSFSATFQNVQFAQNFDQFGLFVGSNSDTAFRGGVSYIDGATVSSVQTINGTDQNPQDSAALAPSPGDTVTLTLSRTSGTWALSIQNLTTPAKSGSIPIVQPAFLNGVAGLAAGIFGSNAQNTTVRTETISGFSFSGGIQNVLQPATTTTLNSAPNPSYPGQAVTLTATVSPSAATGTVTFNDGETVLGTASVNLGTATFISRALALGMHSLTASYGGDGAFTASASPAVTQNVTQTPTTTAVSSSLNPSSFGQNVVFTALVTPSTATGTIAFSDGATLLGTANLSGGLATFSTAGLTAGNHSITANYSGDAADVASSAPTLTQTVSQAVTSTSLVSSVNPAQPGQGITFRATVTPQGATGTITFKDGPTSIGSAVLSLGSASITTTLNAGSHSITAVYSGDPNNAASTSAILSQAVGFPQLSIVTSNLPPGTVNQSYGPVIFIANGGSGSYSWSASGLPAGLSLSSNGSLSGTPTAPYNGGVNVTVTDNTSHATASAGLSLSIVATQLTLNGPSTLGSVVTGAAVSASFTASGGVPPYTWSLSGAGLSVDSSGHVSGAAGAPGNYTVSLTVTDTQNASANRSLSFSSFGITTGGLPPGTTTTTYSASVAAAGGTPPYTFTASGLPPGVTFSAGSFGGTPTTAGSYTVAVHASDSGGLAVAANFGVSITGSAPLAIFSSSLSNATAGQAYSDNVTATGGTTPYTFTQSGGVLPAGISVSSSGGVSGTATVPGSYSFGVRITDATGAYVVGSISLNVLPAPLQLTNGATFPEAIAGSDYPAQTLMASGGVPPYKFSVNGSLPGGLALTSSQILGTPLTAGNYSFTVKVTDSSTPPASGLLGASLLVRPQSADLVLATSSLGFSITAGTNAAPSASTVGIASSVVSQTISYSATPSVPWLTATGGTSTPGVVSIAPNNAALSLSASGSPYSASVVVTCTSSSCSGNSQTIGVTLSVTSPPPLLSLASNLISFASLTSSPQQQTGSLPITNAGGGVLQINSAISDSSWLTVSTPPASIMPGPGTSLTVTADPSGLSAGYYRGTITVNSSGGTASAVVTLFISSAATITVGPSGSQFTLPQGGALGLNTGSFNVNASGGASVPFKASVSGAPWLSLSGSGTGTAATGVPGSVSYQIDEGAAGLLGVGSYYGLITVTASGVVNSPQTYIVVLNVTSATMAVIPEPEPAGLVFVSPAGAAVPSQTVMVYASSRAALPFQAAASTDSGSWLSITPSQGSTSASSPGMVSVSVNPTGLAAGAYRGLVNFASGSSVRSVNVTLIVEPVSTGHVVTSAASKPQDSAPACANAQLVPTQTGLVNNFSVPTSWPTPLSIQLFDTCGNPVGNAQIVATFTNGDPPLPLTTVSAANGMYSGTWTPRKASSQVTITASASAPGYPGAQVKISGQAPPNSAPVLAPNGAGDVFNPEVGAGLGPGNIIQVYGTSLATVTSTPAVLPLPTVVTGTSVIIGGLQAPLFYVSPTQINAQIPFSLAPGNQYQLLVSANGALTTPLTLQLNAGAPAILDFSSGAVVAQHLDGTLVLSSAPALQGEYIVIYTSGLGATDIPVPSGSPSPSNPVANVTVPPVLTLNGSTVDVLFAGLTPGLVGLYQVNFQIPPTLMPGNYTLQLTQNGTPSNMTVIPVAAAPQTMQRKH